MSIAADAQAIRAFVEEGLGLAQALVVQRLGDQILARAVLAEKHRPGSGRCGAEVEAEISVNLDVLELDDALESLATDNSRAARVVEMKFFGGLTVEEIAEQLSISVGTVTNDWRYAKAWLYRALGNDQ